MSALHLFVASLLLPSTIAAAQAPVSTPSYTPVIVGAAVPASPEATAGFARLRTAVAAKDEAALRGLLDTSFAALFCPTDPTKPCLPGRVPSVSAKDPLERLRRAACCDGRDDRSVPATARTDATFGVLDALLAGSTAADPANPSGGACTPPLPAVDRVAAASLAKRLAIDPEHLRVAGAPISLRAAADAAAPAAATFPARAIVPVMAGAAVTVPNGWTAIAMPSGGLGFAQAPVLDEIAPESVCMRRGQAGWKVWLLIGRRA